jgi:lipoprotein LprG
MSTPARRVPAVVAVAVTAVLTALVAGCSGDDGSVSDDRTPEEVMELAATTLDETSGVSLSLDAEDVPEGKTVLKAASGVGTHAPAFEGDITVVLSGTDFDVPVVAVDGKVYAQIPLTTGFSEVDPAEYGAPDPARLMSTEDGFSALLPATEGLEEGETVRGGEDNKEVLTEYTGTVSGDQVANIIPSAEGEFDATYTVSADGELRRAVLTGVFYPDTEPMTYTVDIDDYGTDKEITAP